jgi:diadenosine tetraphosphatase ApaH/serine/threonine PP2A family protein phosphatase
MVPGSGHKISQFTTRQVLFYQAKCLLEKILKALKRLIQFHNLFCHHQSSDTILDYLIASDNYEDYMYSLVEHTILLHGVMCTNTVVSWDGWLYGVTLIKCLILK